MILLLCDNTEQIATWIFEHNKVRTRGIAPGIAPRSEFQQAFDLGCLICGVQVEVNPATAARTMIPRLKRQIRPVVRGIA